MRLLERTLEALADPCGARIPAAQRDQTLGRLPRDRRFRSPVASMGDRHR
jgi:hypothetical protein